MQVIVKRKTQDNYLAHHGIKGQKWGIRRYQNRDGSLTRLGKKHYQQALSEIDENKKSSASVEKSMRKNFEDAVQKNKGTSISDNEISRAKFFIEACKEVKMSELREEAYKSGNMKIGQDYIVNKYGKIELTDSGVVKEKSLKDRATDIVNKDHKDVISKYIDGSGKRKARGFELGDEQAAKIRSEINSKTYKSVNEKRKAIDDAFKKKIREAEKSGDYVTADSLQQQWAFVYDELED